MSAAFSYHLSLPTQYLVMQKKRKTPWLSSESIDFTFHVLVCNKYNLIYAPNTKQPNLLTLCNIQKCSW